MRWENCLRAELQPWCLSLQRRTCPWAKHDDDDDDDGDRLRAESDATQRNATVCLMAEQIESRRFATKNTGFKAIRQEKKFAF